MDYDHIASRESIVPWAKEINLHKQLLPPTSPSTDCFTYRLHNQVTTEHVKVNIWILNTTMYTLMRLLQLLSSCVCLLKEMIKVAFVKSSILFLHLPVILPLGYRMRPILT